MRIKLAHHPHALWQDHEVAQTISSAAPSDSVAAIGCVHTNKDRQGMVSYQTDLAPHLCASLTEHKARIRGEVLWTLDEAEAHARAVARAKALAILHTGGTVDQTWRTQPSLAKG